MNTINYSYFFLFQITNDNIADSCFFIFHKEQCQFYVIIIISNLLMKQKKLSSALLNWNKSTIIDGVHHCCLDIIDTGNCFLCKGYHDKIHKIRHSDSRLPEHNNAHLKHGRRDYKNHFNLSIVPSWWLPSAGLTSQTCLNVKVWRDCTHPRTVLCFTRWCTHSVPDTQGTGLWWLGSFMFEVKS